MTDDGEKSTTEFLRNIGIAGLLAASVVFHVLVHDHWIVTAGVVWGSVVTFFSPTSFFWYVVWVIGAAIATISAIYAVVKYTWAAPVWLDRTRLGLSLLLVIWLWVGPNALRMLDSWTGVWTVGHWQVLAIFMFDAVLLSMIEVSALKFSLPYVKKVSPDEWGGVQLFIGIVVFLGGIVAPLAMGAGSTQTEAQTAQQAAEAKAGHALDVIKQQAPGWRVEKFDKGFAWIAPCRKMGKPVPTETAAWKDAVSAHNKQPALNKANPEGLPPHYGLQTTNDMGSSRMYRPLIPNGKCDVSFGDKRAAIDTVWAFYYRDHNGARLENWP